MELARLAVFPDSVIQFTDEERELYASFRADPNRAKAAFNLMSASLLWTEESFTGARPASTGASGASPAAPRHGSLPARPHAQQDDNR
jgi:hypothetical protein